MASGIVAGLSEILLLNAKIQSVIIAVCDQPFVSASLFEQLIKCKMESQKGIIGCAYAGTVGTPVLFERAYFKTLLQLQRDQGAKKVLKMHGSDLANILFEKGEFDIDTIEDYNRLHSRTQER
jgi:molybdenum cofactor cytidylyltransferase